MKRFTILASVCLLALGTAARSGQGSALKAVSDALGANNISTLQFTATGADFTVGQNFTPTDPWPKVTVKNYSAQIDFESGSMRVELLRQMGATMPRGGGVPFTGELPQTQVVSGNYAWNMPVAT